MAIYLTVLLKFKEEFTDKAKGLLENLVKNTRKEAGCLHYNLHQSIATPNLFIFHEVWENQEALDKHNTQEYIKSFFELAPNLLLDAPQVIFTTNLI